jgi:hypothetical protein
MRMLMFLFAAALAAGLCACGRTETTAVTIRAPAQETPAAASTTKRAAGSCDTFYLEHRQGLCRTSQGERLDIVNRDGTVNLQGLTAHLAGIGLQKSFSNATESIRAHGRFVVFTLTVTNHTDSLQEFSGAGGEAQVMLTLALSRDINTPVKNFEQSFDAENQIDRRACASDHQGRMQPEETVTCQVAFDVPARLVRHLNTDGSNLLVADFGEDATAPTLTLGSIRTYR